MSSSRTTGVVAVREGSATAAPELCPTTQLEIYAKAASPASDAAAGCAFGLGCAPSTDISDLIRSRRTHKSFGPDPVPREVVDELLELARWAPNHHRTNPWRFRVLGPETLGRLKEAAGPAEAPKLERAPTLVVASALLTGDLEQDEEDICATASAIYAVLLAAHCARARRLLADATVLRTPGGARCGRPARAASGSSA